MRRLPISVCLIVKNEEQYLAECLASVKDWVNEIIVVDTGSTDRTVEIAKEYGAKVHYFEWINDFAAARNESLKHATNPWILQLDADEEMIHSTISWFEETYPWLDKDGYSMRLHNLRDASSDEVLVSHTLIRFFRNNEAIRFRFKIHENIYIPNGRIGRAEAQILHKGYAKETNNEKKSKRNLAILLEEINENPKNPYKHYYAAQSYLSMGRNTDAQKACLKALKYGVNYPVKAHVLRILFSEAVNKIDHVEFSKIEQYVASEEVFPEVIYYKAMLIHNLKEFDTAYEMYRRFIEICENPPDGKDLGNEDWIVGQNYANALTSISNIAIDRNHHELALIFLYKAVDISPMTTHLYGRIAREEVILGNYQKAVNVLEQALENIEKQHIMLFQKKLVNQYRDMIEKVKAKMA